MAKKGKAKKSTARELPDNVLPQNILSIGERVEENKNIYISQSVYKEIHRFTKNKTTNESGGMLVGTIIEEFGKTNILIAGFVEAKHCEATPTTLKFTHETWDYVHSEIEKKYKGKKIVGWIHTHPDFGIFLSEYDKFIHQNFFSEEYQVAYVVDPIQHIEGFYFWINGNIEKCKGFYIYDKTGTPITVDADKDEPEETKGTPSFFSFYGILTAILSVVVAFLVFSNISTNNQLKKLESQQQALVGGANQAFSQVYQANVSQAAKIQELESVLKEAGIIVEPQVPSDTDGDTPADNGGENSEKDSTDNVPNDTEQGSSNDSEPSEETEGDTASNE